MFSVALVFLWPTSAPAALCGAEAWRAGSVASGGWEISAEPGLMCLQDVGGAPRELRPRLCHLRKGPQGYGFNLHSDKSRPGQYIRSVDPGSPAAHSGLHAQDRLIEVPIMEALGCCVPQGVCLGQCPPPPGVCLGPCPPRVCAWARGSPRVCVWAGRSSWEEERCWELELAFLLPPRLVTTLMNI